MSSSIKRMVLAVYDYRACYVNNLRTILENFNETPLIQVPIIANVDKAACLLSKPQNQSIFNCSES